MDRGNVGYLWDGTVLEKKLYEDGNHALVDDVVANLVLGGDDVPIVKKDGTSMSKEGARS